MCGCPSEPDNLEVKLPDWGRAAALRVIWDQGGTRAEVEAALLNILPFLMFQSWSWINGEASEVTSRAA